MPLTIALSSLASRTARTAATGGVGIRRIAVNATKTFDDDDGLSSVWDGLARFGGSLLRGVANVFSGIASFSWTKVWSLIVSGGLFIINFNWNITDQQLSDQIKQAETALAGARGALAGATLGYAICGIIPTATLAVFNEAMALYALKELGEEAAEEIAGLAANLIRLQLQQMLKQGFAALYKNLRHILRPAALGVAQLLVNAGILTQDSVNKANKNRKEPWSFASALEDSIESIKDPAQQAYAEEFWEELGEACIEAGYIVAGSIDAYLAQQKISNESILGTERTVEIQTSRLTTAQLAEGLENLPTP